MRTTPTWCEALPFLGEARDSAVEAFAYAVREFSCRHQIMLSVCEPSHGEPEHFQVTVNEVLGVADLPKMEDWSTRGWTLTKIPIEGGTLLVLTRRFPFRRPS